MVVAMSVPAADGRGHEIRKNREISFGQAAAGRRAKIQRNEPRAGHNASHFLFSFARNTRIMRRQVRAAAYTPPVGESVRKSQARRTCVGNPASRPFYGVIEKDPQCCTLSFVITTKKSSFLDE